MYSVYIVQCKDNSFYTGITWNLTKRIAEHNFGKVLFTKNRRPVRLVYQESFRTRKEAAKREKEIKGWRREKKERLFRSAQHKF
jgi:putative endonuclease